MILDKDDLISQVFFGRERTTCGAQRDADASADQVRRTECFNIRTVIVEARSTRGCSTTRVERLGDERLRPGRSTASPEPWGSR
jgi:hypothetical protein